ncbi:MAG: cysteine synthase B, partial [Betaproteobacteria bacterium]|nr:cysteine synthase B [Betaproteobacteria bacterium]
MRGERSSAYPTVEQAIGKTPLVRLQRMIAPSASERGNIVLGKL